MKVPLIGHVAGFLFFAALIVMVVGGLSAPYALVLVALAGGAVFVASYVRASRGGVASTRVNLAGLAGMMILVGLMQLLRGEYALGAAMLVLAGVMIPLHVRRSRQFKEHDRKKSFEETFSDPIG